MTEEKEVGKGKPLISRDMTLGDLVEKYPKAAEVMLRHGLHCIGCHMAAMETVEQGAAAHSITGKDLEDLLKEMNKAASEK